MLRDDFRFGRISQFISFSASRFTIDDLDCILNISYQSFSPCTCTVHLQICLQIANICPMADHPIVCALCNIYLDNGQPTSILKLKLNSCIIIHKYIFFKVMVQSMFNQDKQFAWGADAFIIIFKVDDNKYKSIENVALCFLRKYDNNMKFK